MVKQKLWKVSKEFKVSKRKGSQRRKPTGQRVESDRVRKRRAQELESQSPNVSNSLLRQSKRFRRSTKSKKLPNPRQTDHLRRPKKKKQKTKKHGKSEESMIFPQPLHSEPTSFHGLENLGQTCYFNSIVQCLFHCPLFREAIENIPHSVRSIPVLRELQRLFTRMARPTSSTHLSPSRCFSAAMKISQCENAGMNKNRQEDARGFFLMLVEHLRQKMKRLSKLFEGELLSSVVCQRCSYSRVINVSFKYLALSFPADSNDQYSYGIPRTHDIEDLLDGFVRPEFVTYRCDQCGVQGIAEKKLDILRTPQILVLGLKRFDGLRKINDFVAFPSKLGLKYANAGDEEHQRYQITGVVVHEGPSITAGHYLSYVCSEGIWLEINDSSVREVSWEIAKNMRVYLLFYLRV